MSSEKHHHPKSYSFQVIAATGKHASLLFYNVVLTTPAVSSTNLELMLMFASCILCRSPVFTKFHKLKPNIRLYCIVVLPIMHNSIPISMWTFICMYLLPGDLSYHVHRVLLLMTEKQICSASAELYMRCSQRYTFCTQKALTIAI